MFKTESLENVQSQTKAKKKKYATHFQNGRGASEIRLFFLLFPSLISRSIFLPSISRFVSPPKIISTTGFRLPLIFLSMLSS